MPPSVGEVFNYSEVERLILGQNTLAEGPVQSRVFASMGRFGTEIKNGRSPSC
jgi:hypothetical protein